MFNIWRPFQCAIHRVDSANRQPPPPERISVGIQAQPSWAVSSVQAVPVVSPVQIRHPSLPKDTKDLSLDTTSLQEVAAKSLFPPMSPLLSPPQNVTVSAVLLTHWRDPETW